MSWLCLGSALLFWWCEIGGMRYLARNDGVCLGLTMLIRDLLSRSGDSCARVESERLVWV